MTFFAFKRRLSRFLTTLSLFRTRLASSSPLSRVPLATLSAPGSVPAGCGRPDPLFRSPFAVPHTFSLDRRATYLEAVDFDIFFLF